MRCSFSKRQSAGASLCRRHHYLGFACLTLGRLDEAERHLAAALELKRDAAT